MIILKCKMCGGDIVVAEEKTFGTCEFCGSTITLPKIDSEQRAAAFNRGNHFRRIGEFDKALAVYERIVMENDMDAEAHWCCALCRFGIEYVEDPSTYEWIPTCHRASFDSILDDVDYKAAVNYSDGLTKRQYQKDAARIAEVQKGVLAQVQNTEPFDVFISYKESDENGNRTKDSVLAQDIYYQLVEQGYKVFFSRITLEDVVGIQYEPYIFAALNSAKVMVVVGTQEKYLNATWVKNEWSRFLAMMKKDRSKVILPCYRDMDPYDMPEQLSVLQSYDMSKIGFIQDLIRGVSKIIQKGKEQSVSVVQENIVVNQVDNKIDSLLDRGQMALEDRDWEKADEFFENILNSDSKNAQAYLGKALVMEKCSTLDELAQKRLEVTRKVNVEKKSIQEDKTPIYKMIEKYGHLIEKEEIINLYKYDLTYTTTLSERRKQRREEETFWNSHKWLSKAERFAEGKTKEALQFVKNKVFEELDMRIIEAENNEKEAIKETELNYEKCIEQGNQLVEELYRESEGTYQTLVERLSWETDCNVLLEMADIFDSLENYSDSHAMAEQCRKKILKLTNRSNRRVIFFMIAAIIIVLPMLASC